MTDLFGADILEVPYYFMVERELDGMRIVISRTGYTGELGYELYLHDASRDGVKLWDAVIEAGAPHGLAPIGPCHIRRIEGGILAHGCDVTIEDNPYQVGYGYKWMVELEQEQDFIGREALRTVAEQGVDRKLVGVEIGGSKLGAYIDGSMPDFFAVKAGGRAVGRVTSACFSPRLDRNIGYAMVPVEHAEIGTELVISGRARPSAGVVADRVFYKPEQAEQTLRPCSAPIRSAVHEWSPGGRRRPRAGSRSDRRPVPGARARLAGAVGRGLGQQRLARRRALGVPLPAPGDRARRRGARDRGAAAARAAAARCRSPCRRSSGGPGRRVPVAVLRLRADRRARAGGRRAGATRRATAWRDSSARSCARCTPSRSTPSSPPTRWAGPTCRGRVPRTHERLAEIERLGLSSPPAAAGRWLGCGAGSSRRRCGRRSCMATCTSATCWSTADGAAGRRDRLGRSVPRRSGGRPVAVLEPAAGRPRAPRSSTPTDLSATTGCCAPACSPSSSARRSPSTPTTSGCRRLERAALDGLVRTCED